MTFILTLFLSVEVSLAFLMAISTSYLHIGQIGLVASVCFSLILVIRKSTQARIKILGRLKDSDHWIPVDEHPDEDVEEDIPGVVSWLMKALAPVSSSLSSLSEFERI